MTAAHAFVDDVRAPVLADDDRRHLERVLRVRDGEEVTVSDGRGAVVRCVFRRAGDLEIAGDVEVVPAPAPPITVAFAVPKGERAEWAVQKLTEVGVDAIVLLHSARSVVRWDDDARATRRVERLRRVAREAAMQSRRARLPSVDGPVAFAEAAGTLVGACLADVPGDGHVGPPSLRTPAVLVGPEGGWDDGERAVGLLRVALAPHVLRAETAAVAAGVLLGALRTGLVRSDRE